MVINCFRQLLSAQASLTYCYCHTCFTTLFSLFLFSALIFWLSKGKDILSVSYAPEFPKVPPCRLGWTEITLEK